MAWLRPLTISATAAVAVPTDATSLITTTLPTGATTLSETINPKILQLGFALEYSLVTNSYTGANRTGTRYPKGWVPLVEFTTATPLNGPLVGKTTGTVNPGGEPLSPGRAGGDRPDRCPFRPRPRCARAGPPVSSRDLS
jgi:hypothetical protein